MATYIIVGAGAAGLTASLTLIEAGHEVVLLEQAPQPGGRIRTDHDASFLFDRGFQVLQTAYPAVRKWIDLEALDTLAFESGADILLPHGYRCTLADPFREPQHLWSTLRSPVLEQRDMLAAMRLRAFVATKSGEELVNGSSETTMEALRNWGFSDRMIEYFFKPFFGGVFLERELTTSAGFFHFAFKMFAGGRAVLPAGGIQAVTDHLARQLPAGVLHLGKTAVEISSDKVVLRDGNTFSGDQVVVSTPRQVGAPAWLSAVTLYVATPFTTLPLRRLTLVPGGGWVNSIAVLDGVQPTYSTGTEHLLAISIFGPGDQTLQAYFRRVRHELEPWIADELPHWRPIRHYHIERALPYSPNARWLPESIDELRDDAGVIHMGDWTCHPSLQAALEVGEFVGKHLAKSTN